MSMFDVACNRNAVLVRPSSQSPHRCWSELVMYLAAPL
jgi:hypothetical protein